MNFCLYYSRWPAGAGWRDRPSPFISRENHYADWGVVEDEKVLELVNGENNFAAYLVSVTSTISLRFPCSCGLRWPREGVKAYVYRRFGCPSPVGAVKRVIE